MTPSKNPQATRLLATLIAALGLVGAAQAQKAEVIHWWTSGGESAAIKEFAAAYNKAGGTWVDSAVAGGEAARASALSRIAGGNPPTAAQFNTSKQYFDVIDEGLLNNIDAVALKEGWDKMLPAPVLKLVKVKGHYYAAPVDIHNPAWFWYSKAALKKAGVAAEPKSIDELFAAMDKLKAAGLVPLALGGQGWQEHITFYSMLIHDGGKDLYLKFYEGHDATAINSPAFRKVLADFKRLKSYTDPGSPNRNWNDATAMVVTGKAGFQIMGDWAKGEFVAANQTAGKEFGCIAGFGANAPYMIAGDVFVFPKTSDAAAIAAQQKLATVITSPAAQVAFNNKKGSIPIRTDVDLSAMDICAQAGVAAMKNPARHVANPDALMSPDMVGAVQDILSKFWNTNQSVDDAVKALSNAVKG
jgi:glucose/mannose transport system substrate-binding protein